MAESWPTELRLDKDKRVLTVTFEDGKSFALPAELLRVLSPSADVQGHSETQRVTVAGKKTVGITRVEPQSVLSSPAIDKACAPLIVRAKEHFAQSDAIMAASPRRAVRST